MELRGETEVGEEVRQHPGETRLIHASAHPSRPHREERSPPALHDKWSRHDRMYHETLTCSLAHTHTGPALMGAGAPVGTYFLCGWLLSCGEGLNLFPQQPHVVGD